jgi:hypothetical protein
MSGRVRTHERLRIVGCKVPDSMKREISRQAREDDRTISAFLRRLIAAGLQRDPNASRGRDVSPTDSTRTDDAHRG